MKYINLNYKTIYGTALLIKVSNLHACGVQNISLWTKCIIVCTYLRIFFSLYFNKNGFKTRITRTGRICCVKNNMRCYMNSYWFHL